MSGVGQKLKDARIAKGLTLDDLQQTTKIQKRYLIAIEEGNYSALPGNFYVRAFARQYAETVGLNPDEIVEEVDEELGTQPSNNKLEEPTTSRVQKREQLNTKAEDTSWTAKLSKYLPTIIIVVIVVAILGTVYVVAWGNHEKAKNQQIEEASTKISVSEDVTSKSKKAKASPKSKTSSKKSEKQKIVNVSSSGSTFTYNVQNAPSTNKIQLSANGGSSWDSVYVGGTQTWQGTLQSGGSRTITVPEGTSSVTLSIGNSNVSGIKINGQKLNFLAQNSSLTVRKIVITFGDNSSTDTTTTTNTTNTYSTTNNMYNTTSQATNNYGTTASTTTNNQTTNNY